VCPILDVRSFEFYIGCNSQENGIYLVKDREIWVSAGLLVDIVINNALWL
jgi:hypothetical protein